MRVLPILFNADMVRAILEGRKTVTRRVCKDANDYTIPDLRYYDAGKRTYAVRNYADKWYTEQLSIAERTCPICPGDILYVRETWTKLPVSPEGITRIGGVYYYKADGDARPKGWQGKWKPSIHMPKEATRIWLKVTDVRVERLREITFLEMAREGINPRHFESEDGVNAKDFVESYISLWNSTIPKKDIDKYGWDANPWVWVIEFERCKKQEVAG